MRWTIKGADIGGRGNGRRRRGRRGRRVTNRGATAADCRKDSRVMGVKQRVTGKRSSETSDEVLFGNKGVSRVNRVTNDEFGWFRLSGRFPFNATETRGQTGVGVKNFLTNDRRGNLVGALKGNR